MLEREPVDFLSREATGRLAYSRSVLARFLGTERDNLVYVNNGTVGLNIVARSLRLGSGDELLTTDHEHGGIDRLFRFMAEKLGFTLVKCRVDVPVTTHEAFIELFMSRVTERTRVILISHLTSPTSLVFPVKEICSRARARGILDDRRWVACSRATRPGASRHRPGLLRRHPPQVGLRTQGMRLPLCTAVSAGPARSTGGQLGLGAQEPRPLEICRVSRMAGKPRYFRLPYCPRRDRLPEGARLGRRAQEVRRELALDAQREVSDCSAWNHTIRHSRAGTARSYVRGCPRAPTTWPSSTAFGTSSSTIDVSWIACTTGRVPTNIDTGIQRSGRRRSPARGARSMLHRTGTTCAKPRQCR